MMNKPSAIETPEYMADPKPPSTYAAVFLMGERFPRAIFVREEEARLAAMHVYGKMAIVRVVPSLEDRTVIVENVVETRLVERSPDRARADIQEKRERPKMGARPPSPPSATTPTSPRN